jgi:hypothetical protein
MPSATYVLFRNAILTEQQVVCTYGGRARELCPHIIGTNKDGEEAVLAWQFAGESSGKLPQWRCLKLANVRDARARDGRWHEGGPHKTASGISVTYCCRTRNTTTRSVRIYPWRRIRRSRAPSSGPGTFFAAQFSAGCTTNISGFDLRQAQLYLFVHFLSFLVELHDLRYFWAHHCGAACRDFADGEFIYFGHRNLLCATRRCLPQVSTV